jgi:hypothetical protein
VDLDLDLELLSLSCGEHRECFLLFLLGTCDARQKKTHRAFSPSSAPSRNGSRSAKEVFAVV